MKMIGLRLVLKRIETNDDVEWISVGIDGNGLNEKRAGERALVAIADDPTAEILIVEIKARLTAKASPLWDGRP